MERFATIKDLRNYAQTIKYGYKSITYGFCLGTYSIPNNDYYLQSPNELLESNIGLCYDIVELYREYLHFNKIQHESYFLCFKKDDIIETHAFMIYKNDSLKWYECIDNMWENKLYSKGYIEKEQLVREVYEWFIGYIKNIYDCDDLECFYLKKYQKPNLINYNSLIDFCYINYEKTERTEYSGMAIVLCKEKVLVLETKHNEFVFPKGHIEKDETSKDAAIRECFEESGVCIKNAKYLGMCEGYEYFFTAGHLKIPNDEFYKIFKVNKIIKNIYAHMFEIDEVQKFKLERIFIRGYFLKINDAINILTHKNTLDTFIDGLKRFTCLKI